MTAVMIKQVKPPRSRESDSFWGEEGCNGRGLSQQLKHILSPKRLFFFEIFLLDKGRACIINYKTNKCLNNIIGKK